MRGVTDLESAKPGVIGISNDFTFRDDLSPKVKDTLCEEEIHPRYRTIADRSEIGPLVRRRMHDHLADLAMLGILDRQSRDEGRSGGQYYEYEFSVDLGIVQEVVADLEGVVLPKRVLRQL